MPNGEEGYSHLAFCFDLSCCTLYRPGTVDLENETSASHYGRCDAQQGVDMSRAIGAASST